MSPFRLFSPVNYLRLILANPSRFPSVLAISALLAARLTYHRVAKRTFLPRLSLFSTSFETNLERLAKTKHTKVRSRISLLLPLKLPNRLGYIDLAFRIIAWQPLQNRSKVVKRFHLFFPTWKRLFSGFILFRHVRSSLTYAVVRTYRFLLVCGGCLDGCLGGCLSNRLYVLYCSSNS